MENEDYHFKFKLSFLGNQQVGKTEIINRLGEKITKRAKTSASDESSNQIGTILSFFHPTKLYSQSHHLGNSR